MTNPTAAIPSGLVSDVDLLADVIDELQSFFGPLTLANDAGEWRLVTRNGETVGLILPTVQRWAAESLAVAVSLLSTVELAEMRVPPEMPGLVADLLNLSDGMVELSEQRDQLRWWQRRLRRANLAAIKESQLKMNEKSAEIDECCL